MQHSQLHDNIKRHEVLCRALESTSFEVAETRDVEDGLVAVLDTDGEYTVYFDKDKFTAMDGSDISDRISNFPEKTGFITNVVANSWNAIVGYAKQVLTPKQGVVIEQAG